MIQSTIEEKHSSDEIILVGGKETILVADDDTTLRQLSENILHMFGYTVITAVDGGDAVDQFIANKDVIDLVVLDVIMPRMNGKDALDEMRRIKPSLKVIFVSGYTSDIINKRGMLDQNVDFVSKPMNPKNLLIKVRNVLDGETNGKD